MAYENMVNELHEKIGMPIEKGHLKNRIKTLKHNFYECYDLFKGRSGFAWSPDTKMWTAKPELWKALEKVGLFYYISLLKRLLFKFSAICAWLC